MINEIKWWLYSKCLGWQIKSRGKFIRLSKYRELYIRHSWDNDDLYLTIHHSKNITKSIIELSLDASGDVTKLKNKGVNLKIVNPELVPS